jgi:hypothetical protein
VNWGEVLYWTAFFIAGVILLSTIMGVIANSVIKVKKATSHRVELEISEPGFYREVVTGSFETAEQAQAFIAKFQPRDQKRADR